MGKRHLCPSVKSAVQKELEPQMTRIYTDITLQIASASPPHSPPSVPIREICGLKRVGTTDDTDLHRYDPAIRVSQSASFPDLCPSVKSVVQKEVEPQMTRIYTDMTLRIG